MLANVEIKQLAGQQSMHHPDNSTPWKIPTWNPKTPHVFQRSMPSDSMWVSSRGVSLDSLKVQDCRHNKSDVLDQCQRLTFSGRRDRLHEVASLQALTLHGKREPHAMKNVKPQGDTRI